MSLLFNEKNRPLLITLFDILIIVFIFYFVKGYYSLVPITVEKIDDVQYTFSIASEGNGFRLSLVAKNLSQLTKVFNSVDGHFFEIEIFEGDKRLWTWSKDKFFLNRDAAFTIAPNERKEFNAYWDTLDDWGYQFRPGKYRISCQLLFLAEKPTLSVKLSIKE